MIQHHRGRPPSREMWLFGMVDTSHQPALGYMRIVQDRTAATLLPIIQQHVAQGTVVHSDEWRSYSQVAALPPVQSLDCEPFCNICWPNNRRSYPTCQILLESCKTETKTYEGMPHRPHSRLPWWIYVERKAWKIINWCLEQHHTGHCSSIHCVHLIELVTRLLMQAIKLIE